MSTHRTNPLSYLSDQLLEIKTGASDAGYVEINSPLNDFKNKIVVAGAFELLNTLKNVEE